MAINPLPYTNNTDNTSNKVFEIRAFTRAFARMKSSLSDSLFSLDKATKLKPITNRSIINSSAKLVLKVANILVSTNEENTANTGSVNRKSYQI